MCFLIEQNAIFKRQYSTKCAYILILYTLYCFLLMLNIKLLSIMQRRLVNIVVLQRHPATTHDMLHGILFGAGGGSHFWDLWSVRRQNFRSAFCSTRGEPLDRNIRHISRFKSKRAASVDIDTLKLRRTNVSHLLFAETFTFECRKKESVRLGLLLIASRLV